MSEKPFQTPIPPDRDPLFYASAVLAFLQCIFPFFHWIKVPVYNSVSALFGGSSDSGSYSLFGYIGVMDSSGSGNLFMAIVVLLSCVCAVASIVFHVMYLVNGFRQKRGYYRAGKRGSLMLIITTVIFLIFGGLNSLIFRIIRLTLIPWLALAAAIANRIVINKLRLAENQTRRRNNSAGRRNNDI